MLPIHRSFLTYLSSFFFLVLLGIISILIYQNSNFKKTVANQALEITRLKNPDPYACWVSDTSNYKNFTLSHPPYWTYMPHSEEGGIIKLSRAHISEQYIDDYDYNFGGTIKIHIQAYPNPKNLTLENWLDENPPKQVFRQYPYSTAHFQGIAREELDTTVSKDHEYSALSIYTEYKDKIYKIIGVPFDSNKKDQFNEFYTIVGTIQFREDYPWGSGPTGVPNIVTVPSTPEENWNPASDSKNRFSFKYPPSMEYGERNGIYVQYAKDTSDPPFFNDYAYNSDNGGEGFQIIFNYENGSEGISTKEWVEKVGNQNHSVYLTPTPPLSQQSSVQIGSYTAEKLYECGFSCATTYYVPLSSGIISAKLIVNGDNPEYSKLAEKIIATLK